MGGGMSPLSPPLKSVSHTICPPPISLWVHATMQKWGHVFMGAAVSFMPKREEDQRAFGTASEKVGAAWLSFPNRGRWRTAEDSPCRRSSVLFEAPWKLWPGLPPSLGGESFESCLTSSFFSFLFGGHGSAMMCVFSVSRHFFKTNLTQSVFSWVDTLKSKKTQNIFYQIWWIYISQCKQHFQDKKGLRLIENWVTHIVAEPCWGIGKENSFFR